MQQQLKNIILSCNNFIFWPKKNNIYIRATTTKRELQKKEREK